MTEPRSWTLREIAGQPEALQAALDEVRRRRDWIRRYLNREDLDEVVFVGSGSSYYQAQTMASVYRKWTGKPASAHPSSEIFLFREHAAAGPGKRLLVVVSRSGESSEAVLALESVKDVPGWETCGITCYPDSRLGRMADCLVSPIGAERSTVMTKSFSSMTFMMIAATALAAGNESALAELEQAARIDGDTVARAEELARAIADRHTFGNYIYLGMGPYFGLANEACLKIKEMSGVWTESYGTLEFRHGPKSIAGSGSLVCLLLSETARKEELRVAKEMKDYGATVLLVTGRRDDDAAFADYVFETGGGTLSDEARAVLYLPLPQYLGCYTALKRGADPDSPRNLTQVVVI